jgi:gliding motility-associated-like protein
MKKYFTFLLILLCNYIPAQNNLLLNGSFEDYIYCPKYDGISNIHAMDTNSNLKYWFGLGGFGGNGVYFNSCANIFSWGKSVGIPQNLIGVQNSKSGNGYIGLTIVVENFDSIYSSLSCDYIGLNIKKVLIRRLNYLGSFYTSASGLDNYSYKISHPKGNFARQYTISNIGMYFGNKVPELQNGRRLELPAQINNDPTRILSDTVNWMEVSGSFEAKGTEQYLFIGNFTDSANTNFYNSYGYPEPWINKEVVSSTYYIDDVSLIPQNTTHFYDTLLCSNAPLQLGAVAQADSFEWNDGNKTDKIRSFTTAGLVWVKSWLYGGTVYMWDSLNIIPNNINSGLPKDTFLCNEQTQLNISTSNANIGATYLWNNGSIGKSIVLNNINWVNGKAQVWLTTTANYCSHTDTVTIYQKPALQIPINDTTTCFEDVPQILLDAGANYKSYLWLPTGETSKTVYSNQAQIYKLTVTDSFNCNASKNIVVDELCKAEIFLPNAFTPNGDGKNETYKPVLKTKNLLQYQLKIYDSWGTEVFTTTDPNQAWDAKNNLQGVYVVTVNYQYKNFLPNVAKGTVTLLR